MDLRLIILAIACALFTIVLALVVLDQQRAARAKERGARVNPDARIPGQEALTAQVAEPVPEPAPEPGPAPVPAAVPAPALAPEPQPAPAPVPVPAPALAPEPEPAPAPVAAAVPALGPQPVLEPAPVASPEPPVLPRIPVIPEVFQPTVVNEPTVAEPSNRLPQIEQAVAAPTFDLQEFEFVIPEASLPEVEPISLLGLPLETVLMEAEPHLDQEGAPPETVEAESEAGDEFGAEISALLPSPDTEPELVEETPEPAPPAAIAPESAPESAPEPAPEPAPPAAIAPEPAPPAEIPARSILRVHAVEGVLDEVAPVEVTLPKPEHRTSHPPVADFVMETPVELWFGDSRVGVKAGTVTYVRFRKYADVLLDDLRTSVDSES